MTAQSGRARLVQSEHCEAYQRDGFVHLSSVLDNDAVHGSGRVITECVQAANVGTVPLDERSTYDRAFLQVMNLWTQNAAVEALVRNPMLAEIATELMGVAGVRLYHDQALYKEPGGGFTPWHADQYYWPLSSDRCCTAWIPLQDTPVDMGPLSFSVGSHRAELQRDVPISDESEAIIQHQLDQLQLPTTRRGYTLGDVSFHSGWTFHRAGPNQTESPRGVMTIIYMDVDMRLAEPVNDNQVADMRTWCPGVKVGDIIDSSLNPVLFRRAV